MVVNYVIAVALQCWMNFFFYLNQQVAGYAAALRYVAFAAHRKLHAIGHARRNIDRNNFLFQLAAFAVTNIAFLGYDLSFALTGWAGRRAHHLAQHGIYNFAYLAGTLTGSTILQRSAIFRTVSGAGFAGYVA